VFPWKNLPLNETMKEKLGNINPNNIDQFVQEMITNMFPKHMDSMLNPQEWLKGMQNHDHSQPYFQNSLKASIFETHEHVYIRIPIQEDDWLKNMKVYHTSTEAIIENIPAHGDKHTLAFPAAVKKKGAAANHKDGILEIRIPRLTQYHISEIDVKET
jgi:HSP20 family molecular chaperone IbpA